MNKRKEESIIKEINEFDENEDIAGLDKLYNEVLTSGLVVLKQKMSEAYLSVTSVYFMDYYCGKIEGDEIVFDMLEWTDKAEKLAPEESFYSRRGSCYELLADEVKQPKEKEKYINQAIEQYERWIQDEPESSTAYSELAEAVLEKNIILKKYNFKNFEKVISLFFKSAEIELKTLESEKSYYHYHNSVPFSIFLFSSYRVATLNFDESFEIHLHFLEEFKKMAANYVKKDPFYYYRWADDLRRVLDRYERHTVADENDTPLPKDIIVEIKKEIEDKLSYVTTYTSKDKNKLCSLGHIFNKIAIENKSFIYYDVALNYYLKAKAIDVHTWSYPVYATGVLKKMALIHLEDANIKEAQAAFKRGKEIFEDAAVTVGEDFTLFSNYGKFLYAYAKHIENFNNELLLKDAQQKSLIAKKLGKKFYDSPYVCLAKVALKLGDKDKCIQILEECAYIFSNKYSNYDFKWVQESKDFNELQNYIPFKQLMNKFNIKK